MHEYEKYKDAKVSGKYNSLAMIDIDRFKKLNDMHGCEEGNKVLDYLKKCIEAECDENHISFRVGGDEFNILGTRDTDIMDIVTKIHHNFNISGISKKYNVTISIATAYGSSDIERLESITKQELKLIKTHNGNALFIKNEKEVL